ncbi:MAG: hypothetical protein IIA63_11310 [Nitrospinae bacterium]|nr:hypothetical protein [Nitrospinota bacterium]
MARWNKSLGLTIVVLTGWMLSGHPVAAEPTDQPRYQVAQNVPGLDTLGQGSGTLGGEDEKSAFELSEEGKLRFQKAGTVAKKKLRSTTGDVGEDATSLVPYSKYFTAGYVGEEMDPVGAVLGSRNPRALGGMISKDALSILDILYIDIGQEDDVEVGDRLIVYSQENEVRHPLKKFLFTFEREVDLLDNDYLGEFYSNAFAFRADVAGNQIEVKGVIRVIETASITSRAIVEQSFHPIQVDDLLVPYPNRRPPMIAFNYIPPKKDINGYILSNRGNNLMFTLNDVVYLDKGETDGVDQGDRFEVYAYPLTIDEDEEDINPQVIGEIAIISIQEDTSTGVVMSASEPLFPGLKVRSKR